MTFFRLFIDSNGVQMRNLMKVIKAAFNCELWDVFRRLSAQALTYMLVSGHSSQHSIYFLEHFLAKLFITK